MQNSDVEKIKERLDIVDVVKDYLKLNKTGANYRANCPFHSENDPSFFVSPSKQMFKCFGCGKGGSMFDFVMEIEGVEFKEALKILADKAGVELKSFDPKKKSKRDKLSKILELATQFFQKQLKNTKFGKKARKYLKKRGISDESIKKWRLGYSPDKWRALSDFLVGKGYKRSDIVEAGLAVDSEKSDTPYDRFRGRIIFPIFNLQSQVIAFGGRVFKDKEETAKYINLPNTLLFNKSKTLYGLNFAKVAIRKKEQAILTEGYTDVILSYQNGIKNVVASSGTALTERQLKILRRYTNNIVTAFDMDQAGGEATQKGIDMARSLGAKVKVASMPTDKDPADIIKENSKKWEKIIEEAENIFDFYFEKALEKYDKNTPEGKEQISSSLLPKIKKIPNSIVQAHWVQKLANILDVKEDLIFEQLNNISSKKQNNQKTFKKKKQKKTKKEMLEERIASLLVKSPQLADNIGEDILSLFDDDIKDFFVKIRNEKDLEKTIKELDKDLRKRIEDISLRIEADEIDLPEEEELEKELQVCIRERKKLFLRKNLNLLSKKIKKAEKNKKQKEVEKLTNKFNKFTKKLKKLKNE